MYQLVKYGVTRRLLLAGAAMGAAGAWATRAAGTTVIVASQRISPGDDPGPALQRMLDELATQGGGVLRVDGRWRAGTLAVRGTGITIEGVNGTLLDSRIVVAPDARHVVVRNLTLLETRGNAESYLLDIAGSDCLFENLRLEKRPATGGYQGYLRETSRRCRFAELVLAGSNGLFVAGCDHVFDGFEFVSTLRHDMGGDDAFAIKGAGSVTKNISIRNGVVRGFAAAVSIGSEVGSTADYPQQGMVRDVSVENVVADRCQMLVFIKPGALIYDWRNGIVENISLSNMRLTDPGGFLFARGIVISAARGATVRGVTARAITIEARTRTRGVMPTAAVDITIRPEMPAARVEDIDLTLTYDGSSGAGFAVDHIVRIEKDNPAIGTMRGISIDVTGSHSRISGIYIGAGLDDAVSIRRARLDRIGLEPPATLGAAGIWSDSRFRSTDVTIAPSPHVPPRGGRA